MNPKIFIPDRPIGVCGCMTPHWPVISYSPGDSKKRSTKKKLKKGKN